MERDLVKSWFGKMDKLNSHGTWCCHCKLTACICWVTALRCDCVRERCGMPSAKRRKNVCYFQHLNGFAQLQKSSTLFTFAGIQRVFSWNSFLDDLWKDNTISILNEGLAGWWVSQAVVRPRVEWYQRCLGKGHSQSDWTGQWNDDERTLGKWTRENLRGNRVCTQVICERNIPILFWSIDFRLSQTEPSQYHFKWDRNNVLKYACFSRPW